MRPIIAPLVLCIALAAPQVIQSQQNPGAVSIIPRPAILTTNPGRFALGPRTTIWAIRGTAALGRQLANYLEPATGFDFAVRTAGTPIGNRIVLRLDQSEEHTSELQS